MWDLDGDGYKEPYIVKVELKSRKLLQIIPRFDDESIQYTEEGDVLKIKPENYFIRFPFVPDFNSPIYAQGFGTLLGPLNEAINTTINLLLDTGTLGNMPSGYLGRGVRLPQGGTMKLKPGQWKVLPTTGDDIRKSIFPMPVKEPSSALLNLLNLLITAGEETASVADLMKGGNPGQNQPFSTTMAVLEQGLQVFTSIYKRLFRAFSEEYSRIFYLNSKYLPREHYFNVLDVDKAKMQSVQIGQGDYDVTSINVMPAADPDIVSETQKLIKAESLGTKLEMGLPINVQEATKRWLEAEGHEDIDKLMDVPPPQTPPDVQLEIDKFQDQSAREWAKLILQANTAEVEATKDIAQSIAHLARAEHMQQSAVIEGQKMLFDQMSSIAKSREDWLVQVEKLRIEDKKVEKTSNANKNGNGD
jgi:chaperonin GroES